MGTMPVNTGEMQGGGSVQKACKECGHENTFIIPKYEIINQSSVSMVVFPHPDVQYCEKCGKGYQFIIGAVENIAYGFAGMKLRKGEIITPPQKGIIIPN